MRSDYLDDLADSLGEFVGFLIFAWTHLLVAVLVFGTFPISIPLILLIRRHRRRSR